MSEQNTYTLDEIEQQTGFDKRTIAYYVQQGLLPKVGRRGPKTRYPRLFLDRLQFVNLIREKQDRGEIGSLTLAEIGDILNRVSAETIAGVAAGEEPLTVLDHLVEMKPLVQVSPVPDPVPSAAETAPGTAALAEEVAEISEGLMAVAEMTAPNMSDTNRRMRLGLADANTALPHPVLHEVQANDPPAKVVVGGAGLHPPRRYEDEIRAKAEAAASEAPPDDERSDADASETAPPTIEIQRLGWFLARLQRAMTGERRRRMGTTESWHRAMVTPELTISARNLKDEDAYMLDAVARILKKLLWQAWEE